jgi:ribonuclease J
MARAKKVAEAALEKAISKGGRDFAAIKNAVRDDLTKFFFKETKRKPMILTIIMGT